jgi:hypothetical protein
MIEPQADRSPLFRRLAGSVFESHPVAHFSVPSQAVA